VSTRCRALAAYRYGADTAIDLQYYILYSGDVTGGFDRWTGCLLPRIVAYASYSTRRNIGNSHVPDKAVRRWICIENIELRLFQPGQCASYAGFIAAKQNVGIRRINNECNNKLLVDRHLGD